MNKRLLQSKNGWVYFFYCLQAFFLAVVPILAWRFLVVDVIVADIKCQQSNLAFVFLRLACTDQPIFAWIPADVSGKPMY